MQLSGWGNYPVLDGELISPTVGDDISTYLKGKRNIVARGMGRSYGDSALADSVIQTDRLNYFIHFDRKHGVLSCQAGVTLDEVVKLVVPSGWFLAVTPGTKYISVGGAIASDVHGKNHHVHGCFSEFVESLCILTAEGEIIECSKTCNADWFHATCGGMGLTGMIVSATLRLLKIDSSYLDERSYKTANLEESMALFKEHDASEYSVAWIDCLTAGDQMGRSLVSFADPCDHGDLQLHSEPRLSMPITPPAWLLNSHSIRLFNTLYYHRQRQPKLNRRVHYNPFFYPLDGIKHWNRLYGKQGFLQYQFVIPEQDSLTVMQDVLQRIVASGMGSFLAVLKKFGVGNDNLLSFPMSGYTLALDFKYQTGLLELLSELDSIVIAAGGRVYLTKDARLSEANFKAMYPDWETLYQFRQQHKLQDAFNSAQSQRLGL